MTSVRDLGFVVNVDPYAIIAGRVGMNMFGAVTMGLRREIDDLAKCVGMEDEIRSRPIAVAKEIIRYLDDIVRNP